MQTREELLNDLVEALKISSAYRQEQEQLWRERGRRDHPPFLPVRNPIEDQPLALIAQH